jgi:hypothetical protein
MNLTKEVVEKLQEVNRYDLIVISYINETGYAGCNQQGHIVDRRFFPEAVPARYNSILGIPEPKLILEQGEFKTQHDYELALEKVNRKENSISENHDRRKRWWMMFRILSYEQLHDMKLTWTEEEIISIRTKEKEQSIKR